MLYCYFNKIARSFTFEERNVQFFSLNYSICINDKHDQIKIYEYEFLINVSILYLQSFFC